MKRILVVDDDASIRATLGKLLTATGHEVLLAENGVEAIRVLREGGVDLVFLDVFMPQQDGVETLIQLQTMNPALPIVVMSGGGTSRMDLLPEARLLGAYYTLHKPFTLAEILKVVNTALEGSG